MLYRALSAARDLVRGGERDAAALDGAIRTILAEAPSGEVDYVEIIDAGSLMPVATIVGHCLIALAVRFGDVRLIDNIRLTV